MSGLTGGEINKLLMCKWTPKTEKPVPQQWFRRDEVVALLKQVTKQQGEEHEQREQRNPS